MAKLFHEIRDPIHVFIKYDSHERKVIDSRPFQRLRHINQLGMSHLLYPGATHRRFEHSLGVMELAGRVYDVLTSDRNVRGDIKKVLPELEIEDDKRYWRRVLRMAALCHDIGHLPFSHTAEDLLPEGFSHEHMTVELIKSDEMCSIWEKLTPPLNSEHIAKLAVGPKVLKKTTFSDWETLLSEIIIGNAFGVDRIDYLLRDSHHVGVMYGKFDHYRLIDTLRILPKSKESLEPTLGIEDGGIHSAEALLLARFFMFTQVYLHQVRRIYDLHLKDFLHDWLPEEKFSADIDSFLQMTDNEVTSALLNAERNSTDNGHDAAKRIIDRLHFKILYKRNPKDLSLHPQPGHVIYKAAAEKFGEKSVKHDYYSKEAGALDFPVLCRNDRIVSSIEMSETLEEIPSAAVDFVFIDASKREEADKWLKNIETILKEAPSSEEEEDES